MLCNFYNTQNYVFILQVNTVTKITLKRKIEMEKICKQIYVLSLFYMINKLT